MSKVPTAVWVCLTVAFVSVLAMFGWFAYVGADPAEFRSFLNIVMNFAGLVVSGSAAVYAGQAARQTNGDLDKRIVTNTTVALDQQRTDDTRPGGEFRR